MTSGIFPQCRSKRYDLHIFKHKLSLILQQNQDEDAVEFANRVKRKIAMAGGLVDLVWDGNLKRQVLPQNLFQLES